MRRPKILVCDDDPMIVQVVVSKLMSEGYDVGSSAGGRELLRKMQGEVPDLVIIDAMMPGIDGASIVDAIRKAPRFKDLPIMMLSAKRDPDFVGRMGGPSRWQGRNGDERWVGQAFGPSSRAKAEVKTKPNGVIPAQAGTSVVRF